MGNEQKPDLSEVRKADEAGGIIVEANRESIPRICTILQKGCYVKVIGGCSIRDLLCDQFGISGEYVRTEIKVFFLNASPVDNIDKATVLHGATLALSAAMPGLVGAAMRSDGLSWMRGSITHQDDGLEHSHDLSVIQLKLFNQVMADLGEMFLRRGVYVKPSILIEFIGRSTEEFWSGCGRISYNGSPIQLERLLGNLETTEDWVRLAIR